MSLSPSISRQDAKNSAHSSKNHACVTCQSRKVKCDRLFPSCTNCSRARISCIYRAPLPPRRRKKASPEQILLARCRRLEDLLRKHGASEADIREAGIGASANQAPPGQQTGSGKQPGAAHGNGSSGEHPDAWSEEPNEDETLRKMVGRLVVNDGKSIRYLESPLWTALDRQVEDLTEVFQEDEEEDEEFDQPLVWSELDPRADQLICGVSHLTPASLKVLHPPPETIETLWKLYLENVDAVAKITHGPSTEEIKDRVLRDPNLTTKAEDALLFSMYMSTIVSMSETDCLLTFGEDKQTLVGRYRFAVKQALMANSLLKATNIMVLVAFVLYIAALKPTLDHGSLFVLTGVAVRLGNRQGLHRDGTELGLSPFETEMRRRLYWNIIMMEGQAADVSGSYSPIWLEKWTTKTPTNVFDTDLTVDMTEPPKARAGVTDLTFHLIRCEVGNFLRGMNPAKLSMVSLKRDDISMEEKNKAINGFEQKLADEYLKHIDPVQPIQVLWMMMIRVAVIRMRLVATHSRRFHHLATVEQSMEERDAMIELSMKCMEYDNHVHQNPALRKYLWFAPPQMTWQGLMFTLKEIANLPDDHPLVGRVWEQVSLLFANHPELVTDMRPLCQAVCSLILEAWIRRPQEFRGETPWYIIQLQNQRQIIRNSRKSASGSNSQTVSPPQQSYTSEIITPQETYAVDPTIVQPQELWAPSDLFMQSAFNLDASAEDWSRWDNMMMNPKN